MAQDRINYIAFNEIGNETNQTLLIYKILEWEKNNIVNLYEKPDYPCQIRIPSPVYPTFQDSYLVIITRCGKCGEFAEIFSEIANTFQIENRIILAHHVNRTKDNDLSHAWVEVISGGKIIPIQTMETDGYNSSDFYSCKYIMKYRNITILNGENVSERYYSWCS